MIHMYPDGEGQGNIKRFFADAVQRTVLSRTDEVDYPHVFAVREALHSLRFLHLNSESLRQPSSLKAPTFLSPDGKNLPSMIARLHQEDKRALRDISRDMVNLVPDILSIKVEQIEALSEYDVFAETVDHRTFSAQCRSSSAGFDTYSSTIQEYPISTAYKYGTRGYTE
jgi:predicted ATPase